MWVGNDNSFRVKVSTEIGSTTGLLIYFKENKGLKMVNSTPHKEASLFGDGIYSSHLRLPLGSH